MACQTREISMATLVAKHYRVFTTQAGTCIAPLGVQRLTQISTGICPSLSLPKHRYFGWVK